jgi:hypothetical protein
MSAGTFLVLLSPAVAILVALLGFRRSTRADRLAAFFRLHEQYLKPEVRAGRKLLHDEVSGRSSSELATLSAEARASVGYTLATMNSIAIACRAKYVDTVVVEESMGRSFVAAMAAARPYIDDLERRRGVRPYGYAERLAAGMSRTDRVRGGPIRLISSSGRPVPQPRVRRTDEDAEPDRAAPSH